MGNFWSGNDEAANERRRAAEAADLDVSIRRRVAELAVRQSTNRQLGLQEEPRNLQHIERLRQHEQRHIISSPQNLDDYSTRSSGSHLQNPGYASTTHTNAVHNPIVVNYVINHSASIGWYPMNNSETVKFVALQSDSQEYKVIEKLFKSSNKNFFKVSKIERIQNPYLYGAYLLKKEETESRHGHTQERLLFHGTRRKNIDNICDNSFDWRRHGKGTGHRFGKGVSFTPISNYATHYCDRYSNIKVMLVAKVLISQVCDGDAEMIVPPTGFDTTQKPNGHVIVKYDDNEFYPMYKLYFFKSGTDN